MCLVVPYRVISTQNDQVVVDEFGEKKKVSGSLLKRKVGVGEYVLLQNNFIIRKIDKESAEKVLHLLKEGRDKA